MKKLVSALLVAGLALLALAPTAASASVDRWPPARTGQLTLVHGIPGDDGFPVDITLSGLFRKGQTFEDVRFGTVAGPLEVRPGLYHAAIRPADAPRWSKPVLSSWVLVTPRSNQSLVAHLSEAGAPRLSRFHNDVSPTGSGNARVTVRHLAEAPAVDVIADGSVELVSALTNPQEAKATVPAATYGVRVTDAATNTVTAFEGDLPLAARTNTVVYAVGSLPGGSFTPLVQVLPTA